MSQDHASLVATATRTFGGRVVADQTYESFRDQLYALFRAEFAHIPDPLERLHAGMRIACRCANDGHPWWLTIIEEIETILERVEMSG